LISSSAATPLRQITRHAMPVFAAIAIISPDYYFTAHSPRAIPPPRCRVRLPRHAPRFAFSFALDFQMPFSLLPRFMHAPRFHFAISWPLFSRFIATLRHFRHY
jgi:hypothetical protein